MNRNELYSVNDLKARGWTDTAIKRFLPETPDDTRPNPKYANAGAPMKFWTKVRVHRAEKTKGFLKWRDGVDARRQVATRAVATRIENMCDRMETVEITIVRGYTKQQIRDLALKTHGGNYAGEPGEFIWSIQTARNCIRHNLTNYEQLWAICNRGETGQAAYNILRHRVASLIDEAYPEFRDGEDIS